MTLQERVKRLKEVRAQLPGKLEDACRNATLRAVETATKETPPVKDSISGTNTRSGEMKQHWATDSRPDPQKRGDSYVSTLANSMEYASYVNDGHRMDRHFVPGLYVNPESGLLEYDPTAEVGLVVGTRTKYVPGLFITDKAKRQYSEALKTELDGLEKILK